MAVAVASHSFPKLPALKQELLARYPESIFNETRKPLTGDALVAFLRGYEKAITGLEVLDASIFGALPDLKVVSKYGVGLDMIDFEAARRHGVSIRFTPGVNRQSVAELTIAFMIVLARRLAQHGLETIRRRHTCAHRVDELLTVRNECASPSTAAV